MATARFKWDPDKDKEKQRKHGVTFASAQFAFADPIRVIAEDLSHGSGEKRYYCFGRVDREVLTVRFTYREDVVRIFGAGYWRRGKAIYERNRDARSDGARRLAPALDVSRQGFWLLIGESERFVSFREFPWFREASPPLSLSSALAAVLMWRRAPSAARRCRPGG